MPTELQPAPRATLPRVSVCAVCELAYVFFAIQKLHRSPEHRRLAWIRELLEEHPGLVTRVVDFWDDGLAECAEIQLAAWRSGTLFDEVPGRFFAALDRVLAGPLEVPELPTESPEVREILVSRLERLRGSADLRARYIALLRDIWDVLSERWERDALPAAQRMARSLRARLEEHADIRLVLPPHHFAVRERFAPAVELALEQGTVVLTPLALAGPGISILGLPDVLLIGFGPEASTQVRVSREDADRAASRFKVLSDPTRVAILRVLRDCPYTITDIARMFELSQPTVSVHMKALREAGLVEPERVDGKTFYRGSPERTRAYIARATEDIARD